MIKTQIKLRMVDCAEKALAACIDMQFQTFERPELEKKYKERIEKVKNELRSIRRDIDQDTNLREEATND
jgi:ribosome recycling factor